MKKDRNSPDAFTDFNAGIGLGMNLVKELTDEEMKDLIQEYWGDVHIVDPDGYLHEIAFIRAILRKAQEK